MNRGLRPPRHTDWQSTLKHGDGKEEVTCSDLSTFPLAIDCRQTRGVVCVLTVVDGVCDD
jgi:hypothetical protein